MDLAALLHSVSYAGTWGQAFLTAEEFIDKAASLGFDGVLLAAKRPHVSILDYGPKERAAMRQRIERTRLTSVAIAGYNNLTADMEHGDVPHLEIQVHYITELARLAHDLGGTLVRVFTGYENLASSYVPQWNLVVRGLKECSRRAADWGVTIGVQNHHDIAVGFEAQYDLIRAVNEPNCKALFDAWAPALHGADLSAGARLLGPITAHTTVANYVKRPRYRYEPTLVNYVPAVPYVQAVGMSEGFIDYPSFWREMWDAGFRGSVAYEMCSPLLAGGSMESLDRHAAGFLEMFDAFRRSVRASATASQARFLADNS